MSLQNDRINYVLLKEKNLTQNISINRASTESGIPYTTLYNFVKGLRDLPNKYNDTLSKYYRTNVYYNLRSTGANSIQSNRFRYSNPVAVFDVTQQIYDTLNYYALGTATMKAAKLNYKPSAKEWKFLYDSAYEAQKRGLGKTKASIEEWTEFGSP